MRVYQASLFCLISTFSLSVFTEPNFTVRQDGRSLLVYMKDSALVEHVLSKMKELKSRTEAITVYNHEAKTTFVQFYEYFDNDEPREGLVIQIEDMLEGVTRVTERFIRTIPRLPHIPTQEEIDQRRTEHVARVVHMARNPDDYGIDDIQATIQERAALAVMPRQRQAVLGRLRPNQDATRADVDAMVRDLNQIHIARDRFVQERPAISVLQMLEAFGCEYAKFN